MSTRKVGRPRSFDRDEALLNAMHVFWEKGYNGASMQDLTKAMGINSPSLYSVFGDKKNLYLESIDCYISNDSCTPLLAFETEPDIKKAVHAFFESVIDYSSNNDSGAQGCFLSSSVATTAGVIDGIQDILKKAIKDTIARISRRFELEVARGDLPKDFPITAKAHLMFDLRQGYVFKARAGMSQKEMLENIQDRVDLIIE